MFNFYIYVKNNVETNFIVVLPHTLVGEYYSLYANIS